LQLYLIRHPRPKDADGLCYGRRDVEVDAESLADVAAAVRERIPEQVLARARIFSSPSSRCVWLARALAAPLAPRIEEDVREMSFGTWEGRPWNLVPREQLDAWARDVWRYRPGGGESAEMVSQRWQRWATRIRCSGDDCALAVTHAGVIRVALAGMGTDARTGADAGTGANAGMSAAAAAYLQARVAFGSVHCIDLAPPPVVA